MAQSNDKPPAFQELERTEVLAPTRMLAGKYRLGRMVGEGGMGAVYEAEHTGLGVRVAVKLLNEGFATDPKSIARFRREARASAAVKHPNVVSVTDTGTDDDGVPFLVMEILEGESLSSLLRRERVLTSEAAAEITSQMLAGLGAAHDQGIIHRDLKPGNVFLARQSDGGYRVKILDFGISKFGPESRNFNVTAEGAVIGTPNFMAPEQVKGRHDLDARADLYAVGVLLYRMVTGRLPFAAKVPQELYEKILTDSPVPPTRLRPDLLPALETVILTAMAKDRNARYADAAAFRHALQVAVPALSMDTSVAMRTPLPLSPSTPSESLLPPAPHDPLSQPTSNARPSAFRAHESSVRMSFARKHWLLLSAVGFVVLLAGAMTLAWQAASHQLRDDNNPTQEEVQTGSSRPLRLGIASYKPQQFVHPEFDPLAQYLTKRLNRPTKVVVLEDYADPPAALATGEIDLAALSPYWYVRAKERTPDIKLLATSVTPGGPSYEGYILARADSGIQILQDLRGKVFCYVSPNSTSGYLYPRALFRRAGMDPDSAFRTTRLAGNHLAALHALSSGACDGAAVYAGILFEANDHGLAPESFRVIASTDRIPSDAYCVSPNMPDNQARAIQEALLDLEPGSDLARRVFGTEASVLGFTAARDEEYEPVRKIWEYVDENEHGNTLD